MLKKKTEEILTAVENSYNVIAEHFAQTRQSPWGEFNELKPFLSPAINILDTGCGNGRLLNWLQQTSTNFNYIGIDNSEKLLQIAHQQFPNHSFIKASILKLPILKPRQFDLVTCIATLQHIPSANYRKQALTELLKVTKPGGILFMLNWDIYQSKYAKLIKQTPAGYDFGDVLIPWKNDQGKIVTERYYHAFTLDEITELFNNSSWKIIENKLSTNGYNLITIAKKL